MGPKGPPGIPWETPWEPMGTFSGTPWEPTCLVADRDSMVAIHGRSLAREGARGGDTDAAAERGGTYLLACLLTYLPTY